MLVLLMYLFLNQAMVSAWKITLLLGISYLIMMFLRRNDAEMALSVAILVTGILSPCTVTEPAFIISVCCTILIRWYMEILETPIRRLVQNGPLCGFLSMFLIILVGIMPISLYFGYAITPLSYVLGVFMMPVIILIYILFYTGFLINLIFGACITLGIPLIILFVSKVSELFAKIPFAQLYFGRVSLLFVTVFYMILYCVRRIILCYRSKVLELITAVLLLVLVVQGLNSVNDAKLTFVNVGQGDCAVIKTGMGQVVMLDGGGSPEYSDYNVGEAEVVPYLRANGINKINTIILSHYDKDHAEGVVEVLKNIKVDKIILPDYTPDNKWRGEIEREAFANRVSTVYIDQPTNMELAKDISCEFIYAGKSKEANDNSLVARISYGQVDMLFTGDISRFVEDRLTDVKCHILKVPHHGSRTSSSERFVNLADADFNVISVGRDNTYGHPVGFVVDRYLSQGGKLLRTDQCGEINFVMNKKEIKRVYSLYDRFIYSSVLGLEK